MIASLLVCHYVKHGMMCELSGVAGVLLMLGALSATALWLGALVRWVLGASDIDRKGAG